MCCRLIKNLVSRMCNIQKTPIVLLMQSYLSYLHLIGTKNVHSNDNFLPFFLCIHFSPLSYRFFADTMCNTTSNEKQTINSLVDA